MKKNYSFKNLTLLFFLAVSFNVISQSVAKNTATVSNCGCPGELWNFGTPYKPFVFFPTATNSKRLMHTDYGFNIPASATITGIQVEFSYYCAIVSMANTLKDSLCQLLLNGGLIGLDKSAQTGFYYNTGTVTLGGAGDMWGAPYLTPSDINNASFGFNFKAFSSVANRDLNFDSGALMTIYYNLASGISESQSSSPGIKVLYKQKQLEINLDVAERSDLEIIDLTGKKILVTSFEMSNKNTADLSQLERGIYIYRIKSGIRSKVARFAVE